MERTRMKTKRSAVTWGLLAGALACTALPAMGGCELIVDFDRSKIPTDASVDDGASPEASSGSDSTVTTEAGPDAEPTGDAAPDAEPDAASTPDADAATPPQDATADTGTDSAAPDTGTDMGTDAGPDTGPDADESEAGDQ
jgi:hypothetical protein